MKVNRRSGIFMAIFTTCLLILLSACGQGSSSDKQASQSNWDKIKAKGKIVVATSGTLVGSSYHDEKTDKLTGYEVEVDRELAKRLGLKIEFKEMGVDAVMPSIQNGKIDLSTASITDERKKKFDFSDPFKYSYGVAIVRAKDHSGIEKLEDLKGKKAGGAATTTYSQVARKFGAEVKTYGNATNDVYLKDVSLGRTDVILNDYYLCKMGLAAYPDLGLVIHPDIKFNLSEDAFITKKGSDELNEKINKALKEMKDDGTLKKLGEQFFGADVSKKPKEKVREVPLD
ncbi:transporter substrate-binding domain-containing protein [Pullulanibacillus pueri]|uniref:Putative ABC transporter extracellular-binding protein YckB n=1 Tax=Pullulanibacillus pueri TaxID=1437324 RepID=A0A8J2ZZ93_9BACL|nr:transporter substrate-binding domain-containing protein [Pullulanibacillus pueri]GGH87338.1 putative ABC transporter extracellular-binding protein YckB [Pullulanibacillus pueri]